MQRRSEPRTGRHCLEDQTADSGVLESAEVDSHRLSGPSAALCLTIELGLEPQAPLTKHWFPGGEILLPKPVQQSPRRNLAYVFHPEQKNCHRQLFPCQDCLMAYPLDPPELHSLKLGIGNNRDQVFHFPSQEGKCQNLNSLKL